MQRRDFARFRPFARVTDAALAAGVLGTVVALPPSGIKAIGGLE
jgi:hypothetical protein